MQSFQDRINTYLIFCEQQRRLDEKTLRAYRIDLEQYMNYTSQDNIIVSRKDLNNYIVFLHNKYKQKTVKRKIASIKAFYNYFEREDIIEVNPMRKISTKFREEHILPKIIPSNKIEEILKYIYSKQDDNSITEWKRKLIKRDIVVIELLFATGLRISELCNLKRSSIDFENGIVCIKGKGSKERYLHISNSKIMEQLIQYKNICEKENKNNEYFFINRYGNRYSEQSARKMIHKHIEKSGMDLYVTPHMFRHSFATLLLEEDVDIRYIQKMLGHSSITTTQIYTEVTSKKQMEILKTKHPRNRMLI